MILRVRADAPHTKVTLGSAAQPKLSTFSELEGKTAGWYSDAAKKLTWVKLPKSTASQTVTLQ